MKYTNKIPDNNPELSENDLRQTCPNCNRSYDEIDFDYQSCSKCGWDAENECWGTSRMPIDEDYLNGDADILTGDWT